MKKKRKFNEENNNVEFKTNNDVSDADMTKEYNKLLNNLKNDKNWLKNKIIFKYLPKDKRAIVNPLMRILVNPLYIEMSELLKKDIDKRKIILQGYLIIILTQEFIHLLEFFKEKNFLEYIPKNQKQIKNELILMEYLFGVTKITNISLEQAKIINEPNNWNDIQKLNKIFEKEISVNIDKKEANENIDYSINFYYDILEEEENSFESEEDERDDWYDF